MSWDHMERFAVEYLKHDVLLRRIPHITDTVLPEHYLLQLPPATGYVESGQRRRAQWVLSKALGISNYSNFLIRRIAAFQRWLYIEVSRRVRVCLLRGRAARAALDGAPEWARRAANALQLMPLALKQETKLMEKEGAATAIVDMVCAAWEALRMRGGAPGGAGAPRCACERPPAPQGCHDCRSEGLPPRAALRAAADLLQLEDMDSLLRLWVSYRDVALRKLRALAAAGDDARRLPAAARPAAADWRVIDLALLHDSQLRLLTEESVSHHEQLEPLIALFSLVQQHGLHCPPPATAASAWRAAHRQLLARGSSVTLVVAQKRWHELCAAARARLLALRRHTLAARPRRPALPPLYQAVLRRYPEIATRPQRSWRELVDAGLVYTDIAVAPELQLPECGRAPPPPPPPPPPDNEDDLILVERHVETIDLGESESETEEGCGENEGAHSEAEEVNKSVASVETLSKDTQSLQQAIRKEIQNHREFLRNNVVTLLPTETLNQNNPTFVVDNHVNVIDETSLLKERYSSSPLAVESVESKIVESSKITVNIPTITNIISTNASSLNSLDTGQPLEILQKINPESSEAMIIFDDDDDSDEADKPSGDESGIVENVAQSNEASMDLNCRENLAAKSDKETNAERLNKDDSNIPAADLNINNKVINASPQPVTESPALVAEGPVLVCETSDATVAVNPTEGLNINKEVVAESSESARAKSVLTPESSDPIVSVSPAENVIINEKEIVSENSELLNNSLELVTEIPDIEAPVISAKDVNINKERVSESQELVTRNTDTIVPIMQAESLDINKEIVAENPKQETKCPVLEQATLNSGAEDPGTLVSGPILSTQEANENLLIKDILQTERLNVNEESNTNSSDTGDSGNETVKSTAQNFSIINKNIIEYKTKLKLERVDNVDISDSNDLINRSLVDLFRENLGKDLDITSEIIPKINDIPTNIETNSESEMSSDSNSNNMKMVVDSSGDVESYQNTTSNEIDSAFNMDTMDITVLPMDPKLLMEPCVSLTRIDAARQAQLRRQCRPLSVRLSRLPPALLQRYLGGGRQSRRVRLPDIEEVRRANRGLQCALVPPTPLPAARSESEDADDAPERPPTPDVEVEEDNQAALTQEELMDLLQRCEPPAVRRGQGARYCCLARRHRAVNDARRRLAASARRPPPADVDLHGARHSRDEDCDCCCAHLVRGAADGALAARLARRVRRLASRAARLLHCPPTLQDDVMDDSDTGDDGDDIDEDAANVSKPAEKKKRYERKKPKKTNNEEEEETSSATQSCDGYQEWIRQKNLTTKYFKINAFSDDNQKPKDKPNTEAQSRTVVATASSESNKNDILTQNKYVARVFGKVSKEENTNNNAKLSQEALEEGTKVVSYTSTSGRQVVKICKKYGNRKRKSLGDIVEDIPNKISIKIPSRKSKTDTEMSIEGLHNMNDKPVDNSVVPTVSKINNVLESSLQQNNVKVSANPNLVCPQLFVELNPLNSGVSVVGPVLTGNMAPFQIFNQVKNENVIDISTGYQCNTSSEGDSIPQGEKLKSVNETENLTEQNYDSDDDIVDKLFIDETIRNLERKASQNSDEIRAKLVSDISEDFGQLASENKCNNDNSKDFETKDATECNMDVVKVDKTSNEAFQVNNPDDKTINETLPDSPNDAESVDTNKDVLNTNQNSDQNYKSDEELKTLPVKKVYQKLSRPKTTDDGDKMILAINLYEFRDSHNNLNKATVARKHDKKSNEGSKTPEYSSKTNAASTQACTEDSDDDVQIVEMEGGAPARNPRSLLRQRPPAATSPAAAPPAAAPPAATSPAAAPPAQRPLTLLEQIAQMHQRGKKFVIKKVESDEPALFHSSTNLNQVSQYIELVPETKASQPVVNLNQQLATLCSPVAATPPGPQVVTIKTMSPPVAVQAEPKPLKLDAAQAVKKLQQNAQIVVRNTQAVPRKSAQIAPPSESTSSNASHLFVTISPDGQWVATTEEVPVGDAGDAGAAGGTTSESFEVMPRISNVTSLARPARAAKTIVMKSVSTQSGNATPKTLRARRARRARREWREWRLSGAPPLPAHRFVQNRDPTDITVLCIDSARPPLRLAEDHLVVTEMELPCAAPTYWTVASDKKTRMLTFDPPPEAGEAGAAGEAREAPTDAAQQAPTGGGGLKVKSFARLAQDNALAPPAGAPAPQPTAPELVHSDGKLYRKMTDNPLVYARVLHVAADLAACRRALAAGAALGLRAPAGRVLRVQRAPRCAPAPAPAPASTASTGLRCDGALPALADLVRRLNEESAESVSDVISLDSDDE